MLTGYVLNSGTRNEEPFEGYIEDIMKDSEDVIVVKAGGQTFTLHLER